MVAQSLEQPRVIKRIIEKASEFDQVELYGFKREIHQVNNYAILKEYANIKLNIVGTLANSQYIGRVANYIRLVSQILLKHGLGKKHLYIFGLDIRIVSTLIPNTKVDYEISDILWLYKSSVKKSLFRRIDTFLAGCSNTVTFTSKGFYDVHYRNYVKPENALIKENKFKTYGKVAPIENLKNDVVRIAYIGAFRYGGIIESLLNTVEANPKLILNFYGDGVKSIVKKIKQKAADNENVFFHGAFKNPDHLERIYSENNLNFVVYNNTLENEKVAMPNKFYESGFFNIPILAAENTYVGQRVLEQGMGWTVGIEENKISEFLNTLTMDAIAERHEHIKKLDSSLFEA